MTAWKQDAGKPRMDLVPHELPQGVADVLAFGAGKYGPRNWERGMDWGRVFGALQRHLWAFWGGEDRDAETGLPHTHHAACCIAFLMAYEARGVGVDDRPRRPPATLPNEGRSFADHMADPEISARHVALSDMAAEDAALEWPETPEISPPDGLGDVSATHAAQSAEGPSAARVCGLCHECKLWIEDMSGRRQCATPEICPERITGLAGIAARDATAWHGQDGGVE